MNIEQYNKDLERLRIILIQKKIISETDSIGTKQFFKYNNFLKYGTLEGLKWNN